MRSNKLRGAYMLRRLAFRRDWWNVDVGVPVDGFSFFYNLAYRDWSPELVARYEDDVIQAVNALSRNATNEHFTLVDCGADLGLMTLKLFNSGFAIDRVYAFEPNEDKFPYLQKNVSQLPGEVRALELAVGNSVGRGSLRQPQNDKSDEAAFVQANSDGAVEIQTLDDIIKPADNLIIKLDIEGGELDALRGAQELIRGCRKILVLLEAHWAVASRTEIDPIELVGELQSTKSGLRAFVAEKPDAPLTDAPFFSQFPPNVYNICVHNCY